MESKCSVGLYPEDGIAEGLFEIGLSLVLPDGWSFSGKAVSLSVAEVECRKIPSVRQETAVQVIGIFNLAERGQERGFVQELSNRLSRLFLKNR